MNIETIVKNTLRKIKLSKKEKILVALSGGKDSTVTAYLLKKFGYNIEAIHIDLKIGKYSEKCLKAVEKLCKDLDIKLYVYDIKKEMGSSMCYLRSAIQSKKSLKNCVFMVSPTYSFIEKMYIPPKRNFFFTQLNWL